MGVGGCAPPWGWEDLGSAAGSEFEWTARDVTGGGAGAKAEDWQRRSAELALKFGSGSARHENRRTRAVVLSGEFILNA